MEARSKAARDVIELSDSSDDEVIIVDKFIAPLRPASPKRLSSLSNVPTSFAGSSRAMLLAGAAFAAGSANGARPMSNAASGPTVTKASSGSAAATSAPSSTGAGVANSTGSGAGLRAPSGSGSSHGTSKSAHSQPSTAPSSGSAHDRQSRHEPSSMAAGAMPWLAAGGSADVGSRAAATAGPAKAKPAGSSSARAGAASTGASSKLSMPPLISGRAGLGSHVISSRPPGVHTSTSGTTQPPPPSAAHATHAGSSSHTGVGARSASSNNGGAGPHKGASASASAGARSSHTASAAAAAGAGASATMHPAKAKALADSVDRLAPFGFSDGIADPVAYKAMVDEAKYYVEREFGAKVRGIHAVSTHIGDNSVSNRGWPPPPSAAELRAEQERLFASTAASLEAELQRDVAKRQFLNSHHDRYTGSGSGSGAGSGANGGRRHRTGSGAGSVDDTGDGYGEEGAEEYGHGRKRRRKGIPAHIGSESGTAGSGSAQLLVVDDTELQAGSALNTAIQLGLSVELSHLQPARPACGVSAAGAAGADASAARVRPTANEIRCAFACLGLHPDLHSPSSDAVKKRYRALALLLHPDKVRAALRQRDQGGNGHADRGSTSGSAAAGSSGENSSSSTRHHDSSYAGSSSSSTLASAEEAFKRVAVAYALLQSAAG